MQEAIEFANDLMDQKVRTFAERQAENKRKLNSNPRDNQAQQQPFKRKNVARAYTTGPGEKKEYGGTLPLCTKCNYHHNGPCAAKCTNCKRGHYKKDFPKLKNKNSENQSENGKAHARAYALRGNKARIRTSLRVRSSSITVMLPSYLIPVLIEVLCRLHLVH
ncbi:hypothetical protein Tco_1513832, partial [Tanacetum coccineum]